MARARPAQPIIATAFVGILCLSLSLAGCNQSNSPDGKDYKQSIRQWRSERLKNLKAPDGWLNLAGLYWLEEGKNTIGSDSSRDVVFPRKAPSRVGTLWLQEDSLRFTPNQQVKIQYNGQPIHQTQILTSDARGEPTIMEHGSLRWFIIKRGDQYGLRLRDLNSPLLKELDSIPAYPPRKKWRIQARFKAYDQPKTVEVPNVLGGTYQQKSPGLLRFTFKGQTYELHPTGTVKNMFVVFGDDTNAETTYGGGRFLVVKNPDQDQTVQLDFNKAYNPPCAFTPYATCPLPPHSNILTLKIEAGEKSPDLDVPHH